MGGYHFSSAAALVWKMIHVQEALLMKNLKHARHPEAHKQKEIIKDPDNSDPSSKRQVGYREWLGVQMFKMSQTSTLN